MNKPIAYMLCESTTEPTSNYKIVKESSADPANGRVTVETNLQTTEVFNRNDRRYFKKCIKPGLDAPHINELQSKKSWFGECGHPTADTGKITLERMLTVMPDRAAINILKHWWDNNTVKGHVRAAATPLGDMFQRLILEGGMKSAYSLRAMGAVTASKDQYRSGNDVTGPMRVVTYDWVILPSHDDAYQNSIITNMVESFGLGNKMVMESFAVALAESDAINFIKQESQNLAFVSELLDFCYEGITLSPDKRSIIVTEAGNPSNKLIVRLEEAISYQVSEYLSKFKL